LAIILNNEEAKNSNPLNLRNGRDNSKTGTNQLIIKDDVIVFNNV